MPQLTEITKFIFGRPLRRPRRSPARHICPPVADPCGGDCQPEASPAVKTICLRPDGRTLMPMSAQTYAEIFENLSQPGYEHLLVGENGRDRPKGRAADPNYSLTRRALPLRPLRPV